MPNVWLDPSGHIRVVVESGQEYRLFLHTDYWADDDPMTQYREVLAALGGV